MANQESEKTEAIRPGMFDTFEPPADNDALFSHIERLEKLASAVHTEESARDAAKEEKRAKAKRKAAEERATASAKDARGRVKRGANHVPELSPWEFNSAQRYVVELVDGDIAGRLAAILVMEDFEALHPSPERELTRAEEPKEPVPMKRKSRKSKAKPPKAVSVEAQEAGEEATAARKRGEYLQVEWARRFAWSVALSVDAARRAKQLPSAEEWSVIHKSLLLGAALRAGHRDIEAWDTALKLAEQRREEALSKGGRARWKNYALHEKERELALDYLRSHPAATAKDLAAAIFVDLEHWLENEGGTVINDTSSAETSPRRKEIKERPTEATLARRIRTQLPMWREELGLHVEPPPASESQQST